MTSFYSLLFFPLIIDSKILNRKTKEDLIIGIIIQEVVVILEVLNLGQGTMMIGDQNLFQREIVSNVMMVINLMKKKLIERVEVAVKVAKILIEKQNQQKTPSATVIFFFKFCTWESTTTEESHIRCGADHG